MPFLNEQAAGNNWTRTRVRGKPLLLAGGAAIVEHSGKWILIDPALMAILNGIPLGTGIHVLKHGDEFALGDSRYLFDGMDPSAIVPFPGAAEQPRCPRCRTELAVGAPSVRCGCGLWYHMDPESGLTCFAYDEQTRCVSCRRPTRLDTAVPLEPED